MAEKRMKAFVLGEDGRVTLQQVLVPNIGPYDVLVKIDKASVCGTDIGIVERSKDPLQRFKNMEETPSGTVIGHEGCGVIVAIGQKVSERKIHDYVALESHYSCESCVADGLPLDACSTQGIIGVHGIKNDDGSRQPPRGGVYAEYCSIPYNSTHVLHKQLAHDFHASLFEPAGNSWKIMQWFKKKGLPNKIAVFGCGPHGLYAQLFARHVGIQHITAFETDQYRINFAKRFAAADTVLHFNDAHTLKNEFDLVLDFVGLQQIVQQAVSLVKPGGTIVFFGLKEEYNSAIAGKTFAQIIFEEEEFSHTEQGKQFTVKGFTGRTEQGWKTLIPEIEQNAELRKKLQQPLTILGSLNKLEPYFTDGFPKNLLKIGMTEFA